MLNLTVNKAVIFKAQHSTPEEFYNGVLLYGLYNRGLVSFDRDVSDHIHGLLNLINLHETVTDDTWSLEINTAGGEPVVVISREVTA